jgi:hypothetical protein
MKKNVKNQDLLSRENIIAGTLLAWVLATVIVIFVVGPTSILHGSKAFFWKKRTCTVEENEFDKDQADGPALLVRVRYEFDGRQFKTTCRVSGDTQQHLQRQASLLLRPGENAVCRINPDRPAEMMLDKEYTPFEIFLVMFVSITAISFVTGAVLLWQTATHQNRKAARFRFLTRKTVVLILSGFVVVASGTATIFGAVDAFRMLRTLGWTQVDATIRSSSVSEVRDGDSWNYRYNLRYAYQFDGKKYEGSRWSLSDDHASTQAKMREALNTLSPGQIVPCYVNASDPEQAVLDRRARSFLGLFLVPLVTILAAYFFWHELRETESDFKPTGEDDSVQTNVEGGDETCAPLPSPPATGAMPELPFRLQYDLNRRQRLVPHVKIWMPYGIIYLIMLAGALAGTIERSWWYLPLFLFAVWYVFWHSPGFILGLLEVALSRKRPMDVVVDEHFISILADRGRLWMPLTGIIRTDRLCKDAWTIHHSNGTIISIPVALISDEQIGFLKFAAQRPKGPDCHETADGTGGMG